MAPVSDEQLREMAQHRGMKLVKSRKRTPGVGDYGKYGLVDGAGKPLLGISEDGLTATAADVQGYLRSAAIGTWKTSAETTPDRPPPKRKPSRPEAEADDEGPVRRGSRRRMAAKRSAARPVPAPAPRPERKKPSLRIVPKVEPEPEPAPASKSEPVLRIRTAKPTDAGGIASLLSQLKGVSLEKAEADRNLAAVRKAKGGTVVADLDGIVGCCSWAVVPTVHRGPVGRVTALVVDRKHRREGIASAMIAEVESALAKMGCRQIEVMSDIMINNSHNFFRSLKFEQASYRFVRFINE